MQVEGTMHANTDTGRDEISIDWQKVMDAIRNGHPDPFSLLPQEPVEPEPVEESKSYAYVR
jgi:hypothetical protein